MGLGGAIILHGAYDFCLTFGAESMALYFFLAFMLGGWIIAYIVMKKSLAYTPFTHCSKCRCVIPQLASYCPFCGRAHSIVLKCWSCSADITKWTRICFRCKVRIRFPWHLQPRRITDLYIGRNFVSCPSCQEEIPSGIGFCLHCGDELGKRKVVGQRV